MNVGSRIDRYVVFGNPIHHSKSPLLHKTFAQQTHQKLEYSAACIDVDHFEHAVSAFLSDGGLGLNITVPFKNKAFNYAHRLTKRAQIAAAVNTLYLDDDGSVVGDNTDGAGLLQDITQHLCWNINQKNVLIVGAGGAVQGIIDPIIAAQPGAITIVNRTVSKALTIADAFKDHFAISVSAFSDTHAEPFDIIINATSAGLSGDLPPLSSDYLHSDTCCYDMIYGKDLTPFLKWAKQHGCTHYSDGLGMLAYQGAESFYIWRQVYPDVMAALTLLRKSL